MKCKTCFFPNATEIVFGDNTLKYLPKSDKIHVKHNTKLTGIDPKILQDKINYIEEDSRPVKKEPNEGKKARKVQDKTQDDKTDNKYAYYIITHLSKYEEYEVKLRRV